MGKQKSRPPPVCPYCDKVARFHQTSEAFYRGTDYGPVWACSPCGAWVGCHKAGTGTTPLGRLANAELRQAKIAAHSAFDPLWRRKMAKQGVSQGDARRAGYRWLSLAVGASWDRGKGHAHRHVRCGDVQPGGRYLRAIPT